MTPKTPIGELIKFITDNNLHNSGDGYRILVEANHRLIKEKQFAKDNFEAGAKYASGFHPLAEEDDKFSDFNTHYKQFEQ